MLAHRIRHARHCRWRTASRNAVERRNEDATAPIEVWGYDYVHGGYIKLADAAKTLDLSMSEWRRLTGNANDGGVPSATVLLLSSAPGQATLVLHYWNVVGGAFVEDEARQVVTAINPPLRADMDRDGDVDEHDAEKLVSGRPFRFWINEDRIKGDYAGAIEGNSYNATDFKVDGKFDLVNLFPIVADVSAFKAAWGDSATYELRGSSSYLHFCVLRDIGADETYAMQTGTVYAVTGEPLESATLSVLSSRGTNITYYVENSERSQVVFAFESKGSVYPLISPELLVKVSGRTVFRYRIPLTNNLYAGFYQRKKDKSSDLKSDYFANSNAVFATGLIYVQEKLSVLQYPARDFRIPCA